MTQGTIRYEVRWLPKEISQGDTIRAYFYDMEFNTVQEAKKYAEEMSINKPNRKIIIFKIEIEPIWSYG